MWLLHLKEKNKKVKFQTKSDIADVLLNHKSEPYEIHRLPQMELYESGLIDSTTAEDLSTFL